MSDSYNSGGEDSRLTRLNADGSLDMTFGVGGFEGDGNLMAPITRVSRIEVLPDNRITLIGVVISSDFRPVTTPRTVRFDADGSIDRTYGVNGMAQAGGDGPVVMLPGGQFLVATESDTRMDLAVTRYNADGSVDASFGAGGEAILPFGDFVHPKSAAVDDDGNILLVADANFGLAVTRLLPDGALDESFGRVITDIHDGGYNIFGGGLDAGGKLLVVGGESIAHATILYRLLTDDATPARIAFDPGSRVLVVPGGDAHDLIQVDETRGVLHALRNRLGRAFDVVDVDALSIHGRGGDDTILVNTNVVPAHVNGGDGSDRIRGSRAGDTLVGAPGRDFIDGGDGDDLLYGSAGNDQLRGQEDDDALDGGDGTDELRGNAGLDTYDGGPGDDVEIDIDHPEVTFQDGLLRFFDTGEDADVVSIYPDGAGGLVAYVDGETDTIPIHLVTRIDLIGHGGHDYLKVHRFLTIPARLYGGVGPMNDRAGGNDTLIGGAAGDTIVGDGGDDHIFGNGGDDVLAGNDGNDVLRGHHGNDSLHGGDGDDAVFGDSGDDRAQGDLGNDRVDGGVGDDYLEGNAGHDVLFGDAGLDQLFGLGGNDVLLADDGTADTVRGGDGTDTADVDDEDDVLAVEIV